MWVVVVVVFVVGGFGGEGVFFSFFFVVVVVFVLLLLLSSSLFVCVFLCVVGGFREERGAGCISAAIVRQLCRNEFAHCFLVMENISEPSIFR